LSDTSLLEGNGVGLVRERAMATAIQTALERLYQLERVADVRPFMKSAKNGRETLLVREADDGAIEVALHVPTLGASELDVDSGDLDPLCQLIEGVSHFVYLSHRAEVGRETTALEMEIQAEVDKWVVLGAGMRPFDVRSSERLRSRLYERVIYQHDEESALGHRYRIANVAAARFVRRLERHFLAQHRIGELRSALRAFFRHGQEEKMRLGRAA
jgi:hypothetical protein